MFFEDRSLAPYQGDEPYLFLSYSHKDSEKAGKIIRVLKKSGFRVWYDEGITPGAEWDDNVAQAIVDCSYFVALISPGYIASANCRDELSYARTLEKQRLLVYLEETELPAGKQYGTGGLSSWSDIIGVSAGYEHTLGLKSDGTVIAAGSNGSNRCNVTDWTDIIQVAAGRDFSLGLKSDGTVVAVGSNNQGQCNVSDWTDIVAVAAGDQYSVGLRMDGTVVATGANNYGQCDVSDWANIIAIAAGTYDTVGLKADGGCVAIGYSEGALNLDSVNPWKNITAVAVGLQRIVGLRYDGTLTSAGFDRYGDYGVQNWADVLEVACGENGAVLALLADGTAIATGQNTNGECNVESWKDLRLPAEAEESE